MLACSMRFSGATEWAIVRCRRRQARSLSRRRFTTETRRTAKATAKDTKEFRNEALRTPLWCCSSSLRGEDCSYAPAITMGIVGVWLPPSGSIVTANIFGAALSMFGMTIEAFP